MTTRRTRSSLRQAERKLATDLWVKDDPAGRYEFRSTPSGGGAGSDHVG